MKALSNIFICLMLVANLSCQAQSDSVTAHEDILKIADRQYVNEYGSITLSALSDSSWNVHLENNENHSFDTVMVVSKNEYFKKYSIEKELHFLDYNKGGISFSNSRLRVMEFSSYGRLQDESGIPKLYGRDFYRADEIIELEGDVYHPKGGKTIDQFYFNKPPDIKTGYYVASGFFAKEPYPEAYYSTKRSPQGMFPDDGKIRYRLVLQDPRIKQPKPTVYNGYPVNLSGGEPAIAWEFADSEAYILEGHEPWTDEELKEKISVEGYLVQNNRGSFLKNWKIIDGH